MSTTRSPTTSDTGKADGEQIQRRRGAAHHAEREIDDEQRGDARQRDGNGASEQLSAPEDQRPETFLPEAARTDGQAVQSRDQHLDQRDMPAEREERQRGEDDVELSERRRARAAQRVDVEGERQAHAVRQQLAREAERVEDHLQREAERHADEQLLEQHDEALGRERRDLRRRDQRHDERGDRHREDDARARGHEARAEHRRHHETRADAREREESLRDPGLELSGGERDGHCSIPPARECFRTGRACTR
jgi:hypothetical protein